MYTCLYSQFCVRNAATSTFQVRLWDYDLCGSHHILTVPIGSSCSCFSSSFERDFVIFWLLIGPEGLCIWIALEFKPLPEASTGAPGWRQGREIVLWKFSSWQLLSQVSLTKAKQVFNSSNGATTDLVDTKISVPKQVKRNPTMKKTWVFTFNLRHSTFILTPTPPSIVYLCTKIKWGNIDNFVKKLKRWLVQTENFKGSRKKYINCMKTWM